MLNAIWFAMILVALVCGALTGNLAAVAKASTDSANAAVALALGLVGVMAFWLGLMRIVQQGGLLRVVARGLKPVMSRLFPDVPADHPAMSMMIMNMTANMLGLANAATPFGLKAMIELDKLNPKKGVATDAMALFLAINTSSLAILPTGMIALRASLGAAAPGSIFMTTLIATACSTITAVIVTKLVARWWPSPATGLDLVASSQTSELDTSAAELAVNEVPPEPTRKQRLWAWAAITTTVAALAYGFVRMATMGEHPLGWGGAGKVAITEWPLVIIIGGFVLYGFARGVKVYDAVVEGGKEGFQVALRIIPFLVAILVAVAMLRASGGLDLLVNLLDPLTRLIGMPAEALPMALLRPLSGSGAYAVAAEIMKTHGADSLVGNIVSTIQGSSETTFYVLALYFGVVQVRNTRHTLVGCLAAEVAGVVMSVWTCRWLLT